MNKYLEQLVTLAKIDKDIDDFGPRVEEIEKQLRIAVENEQEIAAKILAYEEEIKDAKLKKSKNELHLAELGDKLAELSKKGSIVKTDKEIKALQLEEEISKEQCDFANEEIERLEKIIEAKQADIAATQEEADNVKAETERIRESISTQMQEIEAQRGAVYEKKQKLISEMSQKILTFYEKIRKWAGNTTVVPVRKQACYGCFMRINDKTYASVLRQDDIITCPHCGRILYKEAQEA